ncbi:MAG: hypothetical protein KC503_26940 [Myxococcales bacterium]|nr:hypothetical protein [Myxococcales bacterium]
MKDLRKLAEDPDKRQVVVKDCVDLIDAEVKSKRGFSAVAVKTAYGLVKALKPNMMTNAVDSLFDDFAATLQSYYTSYSEAGAQGAFSGYLSARAADVAEALLQVTDQRANGSSNKTAVKAYKRLRPKGKVHVEQAVPNLGKIVDKHLAAL